ncbi:NAD(P)H-binding protein [Paenibacillus sp. PL91]|uniref:NAD(P)H-binding protein n=1 Tax=Paenibacillus sp. PL91 TaxID=2729538 RepID=UPI00145E43AA|nr:NAD(P)H-binding protein [Paenibacillus sp. PL91]MBC9204319.1 NAD(P)H-binding protein [Paenibacillus sp. PL91]
MKQSSGTEELSKPRSSHGGERGYTSLLAGATGLIGSALLKQLIQDPLVRSVTVLTRRPIEVTGLGRANELSKLNIILASLDELDEALEQVSADVVFCTLGTTIKIAKTREAFRKVDYEYPLALARFAERTNASLFSVVTAMGASSSSSVFYSRVKGELQDALSGLSIPDVHVFQPSLLLGERASARLGESIGAWASKGLRFAMVGPLRKYRPIKGEDVARAMNLAASETIMKKAERKENATAAMHYYPSDKIADLAVHTTG